MINRKIIKNQAKKYLQGNWTAVTAATFVICLCVVLLIVIMETANYIIYITLPENIYKMAAASVSLSIIPIAFLLSPFLLGYNRMCYKISKGESAGVHEMFCYVTNSKRYIKALSVSFVSAWKMFVVFCLLCIPAGVVAVNLPKEFNAFFNYIGIYLAAAFVLAVIISQKFSFLQFIFFENEELSVRECHSYANKICRSQKISLINFSFSFFPWYLLIFFILPLMYIVPYITVSRGNLAKWSIYNYLKNYSSQNAYRNDSDIEHGVQYEPAQDAYPKESAKSPPEQSAEYTPQKNICDFPEINP